MIGRQLHVATIFGIPIKIDLSWIIILFLLTTSLSYVFSRDYPYLSGLSGLLMGLTGSLLLFASVLAHELSHAVVALRHGITIRGITLFIFGGAAEMVDEPPSAAVELKVALAGPAMSLGLALTFGGLYALGLGWLPPPMSGLLYQLAFMNGLLLAFNVVPGFPLDGGRVLRAMLWGIWENLRAATRTASAVGSGFGALIMLLGLVYLLRYGDLIGGMWYILIGFFLRSAARATYQQLLIRDALEGFTARDLMSPAPLSVHPESTLQEVVESMVRSTGHNSMLVTDESGRPVGVIGVRDVRNIERARWDRVQVRDVMRPEAVAASMEPGEEAGQVLARVSRGEELIPVIEAGRLVGVVRRDDVFQRLKVRMELAAGR